MGHPHPTVDLPARVPALAAELRALALPDAASDELLALVDGDEHDDTPTGGHRDAHVCATAWVLSSDGERILLAEHAMLGWSTPGGHLERGETSRDAALRELAEESGIDASSLTPVGAGPALVHVTDVAGARPHRHWNIGWLFVADARTSQRDTFTGDEHVRWWPCAALPTGAADLPGTLARLLPLATRR